MVRYSSHLSQSTINTATYTEPQGQETADSDGTAGLKELLGPDQKTLGVFSQSVCVPACGLTIRENMIHAPTSTAGAAGTDNEVRILWESFQDIQSEKYICEDTFLARIQASIRRLNDSRSEFFAFPLDSEQSAAMQKWQGAKTMTAADFEAVEERDEQRFKDDTLRGTLEDKELDEILCSR